MSIFLTETTIAIKENKYMGTTIPNIILTPLDSTQITKNWSWQKSYVENHLRKMCIYELKNIPNNNYNIDFTSMNQIAITHINIEAKKINYIPLLNHLMLTNDYLSDTNNYQGYQANINNHICSITSSTNNRVHIFDYEMGPSVNGTINASDNWNILDAVTDIENFRLNNSIDLAGAESIVVKACLSLKYKLKCYN